MRDLGTLGGSDSDAWAIGGGVVVGNSDGPHGSHAFAYDLDNPVAGMRDLGGLGGSFSRPVAVDGNFVVGYAGTPDFTTHAFAFDLTNPLAEMRDLGTLGGSDSFASAISGQVVVGYSYVNSGLISHAFAFDLADPNATMQDLDPLDGDGESVARAINDDGVIVGWARLSENQSVHAVAWRPTGRLIGSADIQPNVDANPAGTAEAFSYMAAAAGDVDELAVYLDPTNQTAKVQVGLYASTAAGSPGTLLAAGWIDNPVAGAWNHARVPETRVEVGTRYWLAVLTPHKAGSIRFRDMPDGAGGQAQTSAQKSLSALPDLWKSGTTYANSPASLYADQAS
jgi:probable HAF family extracellular repeat protein